MSHYKVELFFWEKGKLNYKEKIFNKHEEHEDNYQEALEEAGKHKDYDGHIKIFDHEGHLVHYHPKPTFEDNYA